MWLPFDEKLGKELKYLLWKQVGLGEYQQVERSGPKNLLQWKASWMVFRVALIGLGVAAPGALDAYLATFVRFLEDFPEAWGMICEAEDHPRRHESLNIRREIGVAYYQGHH